MTTSLQTRLEAAQHRRYAGVARMENAMHAMTVAERNGGGPDPKDSEEFETARGTVQAVDVELRELQAEAREMLGDAATVRLDMGAASGMDGVPEWGAAPGHARVFGSLGTPGRVDSSPLWRALQASGNRTTGRIVCKTLLQGVGAGQLGRSTMEAPIVAAGTYGAFPLCLSVQGIPVTGGILHWNRVEPNAPPALGPATAEGVAKTNVVLKSTPVSSILATYAAYEKVSVQSLDDQVGLAQAVEALLTGACLRSADADAYAAFLAGGTAIVPDATDGILTILKTAALIANAGGTGIRAIVSPVDYVLMMTAKASTAGSWMGLPPGMQLPDIVQSSGIPSNKLVVTAGTDGAFTAFRQTLEALIGLDGNDFTLNLRTLLVEGRMVSGVRNPALCHVGDLQTP